VPCSRKHSRAYYLFPLLFFQAAFLHAFFDLREISERSVSLSWFAMTLLVHTAIFIRNSGLGQPITERATTFLQTFGQNRSASRELEKRNLRKDPLFILQYVAEKGMLYDLCDFCACGMTPFLVSFFIARDGFFTLYGTGIYVSACNLPQVWLRFVLLLAIKLTVGKAARTVLARHMRLTIVGKKTIHGESPLAAELDSAYNLVAARITEKEEGDEKQRAEVRRRNEVKKHEMRIKVLRRVLSSQLDADEMTTVEEDFDFANSNYRTLWRNMVKGRTVFLACSMALQVTSIYRVTGFVPKPDSVVWHRNGTSLARANASCYNLPGEMITFDDVYATPHGTSWAYIELFATSLALDPELRSRYDKVLAIRAASNECKGSWHGWGHKGSHLPCNTSSPEWIKMGSGMGMGSG